QTVRRNLGRGPRLNARKRRYERKRSFLSLPALPWGLGLCSASVTLQRPRSRQQMLLRLNRQHPPPRLPRLLAKVRRLAEVPPNPRPDSLRLEQQVRQRQVAEGIRRTSPRAPRRARSRARIRIARRSRRKAIRNSCRPAATAVTAAPAAAWVRLSQTRSGAMAATTTRCAG